VTPSEITETVPWIETKEKSEARRPYRIGKRSDAEFLVITFTVPEAESAQVFLESRSPANTLLASIRKS